MLLFLLLVGFFKYCSSVSSFSGALTLTEADDSVCSLWSQEALAPYQHIEEDLKSLKEVLEMKNQQIHQQEVKISELEIMVSSKPLLKATRLQNTMCILVFVPEGKLRIMLCYISNVWLLIIFQGQYEAWNLFNILETWNFLFHLKCCLCSFCLVVNNYIHLWILIMFSRPTRNHATITIMKLCAQNWQRYSCLHWHILTLIIHKA